MDLFVWHNLAKSSSFCRGDSLGPGIGPGFEVGHCHRLIMILGVPDNIPDLILQQLESESKDSHLNEKV